MNTLDVAALFSSNIDVEVRNELQIMQNIPSDLDT